jgi:5'-nucleotidase
MSKQDEPLILLTNDDGIESPGLWAAAEALSCIGFVTVAAPREQASGSGRSMPTFSDGRLREEVVNVRGKNWKVYAVGGSPAQAVQHGILELMPRLPDLVVAGINYGENLTVSITISGTVGAAMEGAAFGVPAMAVSLELPKEFHSSYSQEVDFSAAAYFTEQFAGMLLEAKRVPDVDLLKIDVPCDATKATPWRWTRLSRTKYFVPVAPGRQEWDDSAPVDYEVVLSEDQLEPDSDVYAIRIAREVSVTPLSLDNSSRVDFEQMDTYNPGWEPGCLEE